MTNDLTARLRPALAEIFDARTEPVPAVSVAVLLDGELATIAFGAEPAARFQSCSISKSIAAATALRLGLDLDTDVNDYLRSWTLPSPKDWRPVVTVRHLLSHTGALTVHGFPGYAEGDRVPSAVDVLDGTGGANTDPVRIDGVPGVTHRYSGGGYQILQLIIEDLTGDSFAATAAKLVFAPLGMDTAGYDVPPVVAPAHDKGEPIKGGWHTYPEQAAAGLWCTPADLVRFFTALRESAEGGPQPFLPPELAAEMLTECVPGYGLGVRVAPDPLGDRFGHTGSNEGYRCAAEASRREGWAIAAMTNANEGTVLVGRLIEAAAEALGIARTPEPVDPEGEYLQWLDRHAGEYRTEHGTVLRLDIIDDYLHLVVPGQPPLIFGRTGDTSAYAPYAHAELRFAASGGSVESLTLHQFGSSTLAVRQSVDG